MLRVKYNNNNNNNCLKSNIQCIEIRVQWTVHLSSKGLGIIFKARAVLDQQCLLTLYNSFVYPLPYLTRVPYHVDVGCYLTMQTKLLYLLSGGSVLLTSFLSSFAGTSGWFPSGGPELSCLLHSL